MWRFESVRDHQYYAPLAEWPGAELQPLLRQFDSDAVFQFDGRLVLGGTRPACTRQSAVRFRYRPPVRSSCRSRDRMRASEAHDAGSTPATTTSSVSEGSAVRLLNAHARVRISPRSP